MSDIDNDQVTTEVPEPAQPDAGDDFADSLELEAPVGEPEVVETPKAEEPEAEETTEPVKEEEATTTEEPIEPAKADEPEQQEEVLTEAEQKRHNYEMAQKRIQERDAAKRTVEQAINNQYQPQAVDEIAAKFVEQGYNQFEAEMLARDERREQQAQIAEARTQIAELNMTVETESIQVMHDYPVFDPNSKEYDKEFASKASALYERAAGLQTDPNTGYIVSAAVTPYNFFKDLAEMRSSGLSKAQTTAQKNVEKQMASVAPQSSTVPAASVSKEDKEANDLSAAFDLV